MPNMEMWKENFLLWIRTKQSSQTTKTEGNAHYCQLYRYIVLPKHLAVYEMIKRERNNLVSIGWWRYELVLAVDSGVCSTSHY